MKISRLAATALLVAGITGCTATGGPQLTDFPLSEEPLLGKFVWHDLMTDDVASAQSFYSGLFGWTFVETVTPNGRDYVVALADGQPVGGLVQVDDPAGANYSRWMGYMSVADVDAAVDTTRDAGGNVVVGPTDIPNIGRAAAIQDPQGAVLGLIRSDVGDPVDRTVLGQGEVSWNELLANDDAAAASFYQSLADFEVVTLERPGGLLITLNSEGTLRAGILNNPFEGAEPTWLTFFAVDDPVAAAARAEALGGTVFIEPSDEVRNGTVALIADPTGAALVLHKRDG